MNDIITIKKERDLKNAGRRSFLKMVSFGTAAVALTLATKKVSTAIEGVKPLSEVSSKKNKISKSLSFAEDAKEFTFFDAAGNELLIFEKEV